jgi:putative ABC transport system permease protein
MRLRVDPAGQPGRACLQDPHAGGCKRGRLKAIQERAATEFPEAGWSIRTRSNAAPALSANIERFSQFLTLVGLTALVVGGVGVANAVRAYLDGKRGVIATFKSLGASGGFVCRSTSSRS